MKSDERNLVRAAARGDRSAMADLYSRNIGYLTAVCSRYIQDNGDRDDVLQCSFIKILSSLGRFDYRGEGSLKAWMSRIVVNESLKFLKNRQKDRFILFSDIPDIPEEEDPVIDDIPAETLQKMVRELPDGYRTVFNLSVFEGRSHKEIASMLGITESTSASQFHRARNLLAKRIREYRNSKI